MARPLVVGGSSDPRSRCRPSTGTTRLPIVSWLNPKLDHAATAGWLPTSRFITPGPKFPYPPSAWIRICQFQPYRTGWLTRPVRLAPNTAAAITAVTAAMDPSKVARTGTACCPDPGSSALRLATTAGADSPAAAAARATAEGRSRSGRVTGRVARAPITASTASRITASSTEPAPRTSPSASTPRAGSNWRTWPTGASGESAIAPATARMVAPRTAATPGRQAASAVWARLPPRARSTDMSWAARLISCARPCPASTSMASAAIAPKTASATTCGPIACRTSLRTMSWRATAKLRPTSSWRMAADSCRCTVAARLVRWCCRAPIPAVP